jgi:hypothetical protein
MASNKGRRASQLNPQFRGIAPLPDIDFLKVDHQSWVKLTPAGGEARGCFGILALMVLSILRWSAIIIALNSLAAGQAGLKAQGKSVTPENVLAAQRDENKQTKKHVVSTAAFSADGPF